MLSTDTLAECHFTIKADATTLELSTMCGHGMLSANFTKKMLEWVRENRRTPEEAARYMARFCICGVFNLTRAEHIIKRACNRKP